jgi:hypothetical protein
VSETPRHRVCGGLFGDIPGFAAACAGHRRGDAVLAEPQRGGDRSRTDGVDADASRANVLGERLREVQKGDLGGAVIDDQRVRQDGFDLAGADDGAGTAVEQVWFCSATLGLKSVAFPSLIGKASFTTTKPVILRVVQVLCLARRDLFSVCLPSLSKKTTMRSKHLHNLDESR